MKLKTIQTFDNFIEAYLLKSKLEDENIYCFLQDEYQVALNPIHSQAFGGIKLQVKEDDWLEATRILEEINQKK